MVYIQLNTGIIWAHKEVISFNKDGFFSGECHKMLKNSDCADVHRSYTVEFHKSAIVCGWKETTRVKTTMPIRREDRVFE